MKTRKIIVTLALLCGFIASGAAMAAGKEKMYIGLKTGPMDADITGFDNAWVAGIYGGYNMLGKDALFEADLHGGVLAAEAEMNMTISKGDAGAAGDWDINNFNVFAAYRHPLSAAFYLKGKAGVAYYNIGTTQPSSSGDVGNNWSLAMGIGGGWNIGPGSLELEVTTYSSNVLYTSLGFHMTF